MRVKHVTLTNFRGFERLELDLDRPVTVLVGVNGAGKSSLLRAIGAAQTWLLSIYNRRHELPGVSLDVWDLRVGATAGEIINRMRHGACDFAFRVWWDAEALHWQGFFHESTSDALFREGGRPFMFLVSTDRHVESANLRNARAAPVLASAYFDADDEEAARSGAEDTGAIAPRPGYARFIEWFKEREDVENARRVASRNLDMQDPYLRAVREAVAALMPGFDNLRIQREFVPPAMVVSKGGVELRLDQLSDGERNLIALAGDLARRLVLANPTSAAPRETEGVILIDEVEQHLHPALQRKVLPALQRAFPNAQFIVTTHSPQVLSSVPASAVVVLDGFDAVPVASPTRGRDTNAILREVFGTPERPQEQAEEVLHIARLIERDQLDEARARLALLAELLSEHDGDVLRLRTKLDFAAVGL